jgi:hypothetical protein
MLQSFDRSQSGRSPSWVDAEYETNSGRESGTCSFSQLVTEETELFLKNSVSLFGLFRY